MQTKDFIDLEEKYGAHNYRIVDNINWDYLSRIKNYKYRTY